MWVLVVLGVVGFLLAHRGLAQPYLVQAVVTGGALSLVLFLTLLNGLARFMVVSSAAWWSLGILVLLAGVSWFLKPPRLQPPKLPVWVWVWLAGVLTFTGLFITLAQNLWLDDDYWIHTPLQGLMGDISLPPIHPFFADIQMNGHYGRDLLIVGLSELSDSTVFTVQMVLTTVAMLLTVALIFLTLQIQTRSQPASVLGTTYVLFGINVGGRAGLVDTFQNNNALVAMYVVLIIHLYCQLWSTECGGKGLLVRRCVLTGLCLGNLAIVYETHFGLLLFVLISGTVVRRFLLKTKDIPLWCPATVLGVALLLAVSQGGPLTKIASGLLSPAPQVRELSPGEMNQRQVVKLKFPKKELFQIQLARGYYQRVSCAYEAYPKLAGLAPYSEQTPYRYIWSWDVLQIHWLSTLLVPLSLLLCFRHRVWSGLCYLAFGLIAFLVPAVVNFGPIYEFEYFRWQFAAGFGFAVGLGVAAGYSFEQARWRKVTGAVIVLLTLVNIYPFFALRPRLINWDWEFRQYQMRYAWPLKSKAWLRTHTFALGIEPHDIEAASFLRGKAKPGQRALMNFPTDRMFAILCESTFVGISGVRMVGHSLPLVHEIVGTPPYHMSATARAFWGEFDPVTLSVLGVDWIYLRPGEGFGSDTRAKLEAIPGLKLAAGFPPDKPQAFLYRVELPQRNPVRGDGDIDVLVRHTLSHPATSLARGTRYRATLEIENRTQALLSKGTLMECSFPDVDTPRERIYVQLENDISPGEAKSQNFWIVSPHEPGIHQPVFRIEQFGELALATASGEPLRVEPDFRRFGRQLRSTWTLGMLPLSTLRSLFR